MVNSPPMPTMPKVKRSALYKACHQGWESPDMTFVPDIRGEFAIPQTMRYPIKPASPNVKTSVINRRPVTVPSATAVPMPDV